MYHSPHRVKGTKGGTWSEGILETSMAIANAVHVIDDADASKGESIASGTIEERSSVGHHSEESINLETNNKQARSRLTCYRKVQAASITIVVLALVAGSSVAVLFGAGVIGISSNTEAPTNSTQNGEGDNSTSSSSTTPTQSPIGSPTMSPKASLLRDTIATFSGSRLDDPNSPQWKAYQWLAYSDSTISSDTDTARIQQRYALATLYFALAGELPPYASYNECDWPTVECRYSQVTEIRLARQSFTGTIPPEIELLAPSLAYLDLAENPQLHSFIPDELYNLVQLEYLYLHNTAIMGSLSEDIGKLELLVELLLNNNELTGTIPMSLGPNEGTGRPLRFLSLHNNDMTGSIPEGLNLWYAFYLDLSFNRFSGTLPSDIGVDFFSLRHLYLDHNQFEGTIPESYASAGRGGLVDLYLNDNQLTGGLPTSWDDSPISTIKAQNNNLTITVDSEICKMSFNNRGSLVELGVDCEICRCKDLCDKCPRR